MVLRGWCAPALCVAVLAGPGCYYSEPVREDRSIQASPAGDRAGFQHGTEGIFVAGTGTTAPVRIFSPGAEVCALSPPMWNADNTRLIFTSAQTGPASFQPGLRTNPVASGSVSFASRTIYTCWLREGKGPDAAPVELFHAECGHPGYVAANLAARWHPAGGAILHISREGDDHGLYSFDLATKNVTRVFPHLGDALLFELSPDGKHIACVVASHKARNNDGIWIGRFDDPRWQRVEGSEDLADSELPSVLEQLRATKPAWSTDGERFAFVTRRHATADGQPEKHRLHIGSVGKPTARILWEASSPVRDVHWSPDGRTLGFLNGDDAPRLNLIAADAGPPRQVGPEGVTAFPGWDKTGKHLAFIAADGRSRLPGEDWALLYARDPVARQGIFLTDGTGQDKPRQAFHGLRVTFPNWSVDQKLTAWLTYQPAYRFWPALVLGRGGRSGDPAATIDATTGKVEWMPVNVGEKVQIGHWHLLRGEAAEAQRLYAEAEPHLRAEERADAALFFFVCASQLNRTEEALRWRPALRNDIPPLQDPAMHMFVNLVGDDPLGLGSLLDPKGLPGRLLRDFYAGERFICANAMNEGIAFFQAELKSAATEAERFSSAVVLAQLLLMADRRGEYVHLVMESVIPMALQNYAKFGDTAERPTAQHLEATSAIASAGVTIAPLAHRKFLDRVPDRQVEVLAAQWQRIQEAAADEKIREWATFLSALCLRRLGDEAKLRATIARFGGLDKNGIPSDQEIADLLAGVRAFRADIIAGQDPWARRKENGRAP